MVLKDHESLDQSVRPWALPSARRQSKSTVVGGSASVISVSGPLEEVNLIIAASEGSSSQSLPAPVQGAAAR